MKQLADISTFNAIDWGARNRSFYDQLYQDAFVKRNTPNSYSETEYNPNSFSLFDNPDVMADNFRVARHHLGGLLDRCGIPGDAGLNGLYYLPVTPETAKDSSFFKEYKKLPLGAYGPTYPNENNLRNFNFKRRILMSKTPDDYVDEPFVKTLNQHIYHIIHEMIHAVADLPGNDFMEPYSDSLSVKEKVEMDLSEPYALCEYSNEPGVLKEYSSTIYANDFCDQHRDNVFKRWRDNAQMTTDEVINRPYSTIRQYLGVEQNPNKIQKAQEVIDSLKDTCSYAQRLSDFGTYIMFTLNKNIEESKLTQDDMQEVPLVRDKSSSYYGSTTSGAADDSSKYGMFAKNNPHYRTARKPIEQR